MIHHLLVPLDGSRLAESAFPAASYLASILDAEVTLIHVIERNPPEEVHGETHLRSSEEAEAYLRRIAESAFSSARRVGRHVHIADVGNVSKSIVRHEGEMGHDLVVMCTHGRGGAAKLLFGSIAQQVIADGTVPVLLVRSSHPFTLRAIVVPMDGHPDHEEGLLIACDLARASGATIHLLMAVPTFGSLTGKGSETGILLPGATRELLEMSVEGARGYLEQKAGLLKEEGIRVKDSVVRGDPARAIVRAANSDGADLIVLATHGKKGMDAVFSGSVAYKVVMKCAVPLLLVPAGKGKE